jgi:hypothetical protein
MADTGFNPSPNPRPPVHRFAASIMMMAMADTEQFAAKRPIKKAVSATFGNMAGCDRYPYSRPFSPRGSRWGFPTVTATHSKAYGLSERQKMKSQPIPPGATGPLPPSLPRDPWPAPPPPPLPRVHRLERYVLHRAQPRFRVRRSQGGGPQERVCARGGDAPGPGGRGREDERAPCPSPPIPGVRRRRGGVW